MCYNRFRSRKQHHSACIDILAGLITAVSLAVIIALFTGTQAVWAQTCMNDNFIAGGNKGNLNCTASEVYIAEDPFGRKIIDAQIVDGDNCAYPLDTATVDIVATIHFNATRYDVGIYSALDGRDGLYGECAVVSLPLSPPPAADIDGYPDTCGDVVTGTGGADLPGFRFQRMKILCEDSDNDGFLDFSTCFSWRTSGNNSLCNDVTDLYPGTKSKCFCERVNIPVEVPAAPISMTKTASPASVYEPGGQVTFTVSITNYSIDPYNDVTIDTLWDDVYGDLHGIGNCSVPQTVIPGVEGTYSCSFTEMIWGNAKDSQTNTVWASGFDSRVPVPNPTEDNASATVTVLDVLPTIKVEKTANPENVPEPGGSVNFTVMVTNNSVLSDPVQITSLTDSVYGDLNGRGNCSVPQTIEPDKSYSCTFTASVSGNAYESKTNVATASGKDDEGNSAKESNDATVTIDDVLPKISVEKTANPENVPEPGGSVNFTVVVTNNSVLSDPVKITSLTDSVYGDLNGQGDCSVPQTIEQGMSYSCTFSAYVSGNAYESKTNLATASCEDDEKNSVKASNDATVTIDDVLPTISVEKTANPDKVYEPGGSVNFTVMVTNNSVKSDPVKITSLTDSVYGDLNGQGSCLVPQTIEPGKSYSCTFTADVSGNAGEIKTNVATASGEDDEGNPVSASNYATVTILDVKPTISVKKTANPDKVYEPGDSVDFTVVVTNNSVSSDSVKITSLTDSVHGDLNGQGDCSVPQTIEQGMSYSCTFSAYVSGNAGEIKTNVATAFGEDDEGNSVKASNDATVTIDDIQPKISVEKTANPYKVYEPGDSVDFTVVVTNHSVSSDPVKITSLTDNIHGDLNGQGDCSVPQTIEQGMSYSCTFSAYVSGNAYEIKTNVATASGEDDEGNSVKASNYATVTIDDVQPKISVEKTANPENVPEPGGLVDFTVVVTNHSVLSDPVKITSLTDNIHGNLNGQGDCSVPQTIEQGMSYSCTFSAYVSGNAGEIKTNVATASGEDDEGNPVKASNYATVTIDDVQPAIKVEKTANPENVPEPGGLVDFTVVVKNESVTSDSVKITSLTDSVYGDLNGQGDCLVPQTIEQGMSYSCTFSAYVSGNAGEIKTNVATASGEDDEGNPVKASNYATVTIDDVQPAIKVEKTANPENVPEPGGSVNFTVIVTNNSVLSDPVKITSLTDSVHGDLNGQGDCSVPQIIDQGMSYSCTFSAYVSGNAYEIKTNVATASGEDDEGNLVSASNYATVTIKNVPPDASLTKTVTAVLVTYTVTVTNNSNAESLTLDTLSDDVYGIITDPDNKLINSTDCKLPHTLAPNGNPDDTYTCSFDAWTSTSPTTDTVTGTVRDDDGSPAVTPSDSATVNFE